MIKHWKEAAAIRKQPLEEDESLRSKVRIYQRHMYLLRTKRLHRLTGWYQLYLSITHPHSSLINASSALGSQVLVYSIYKATNRFEKLKQRSRVVRVLSRPILFVFHRCVRILSLFRPKNNPWLLAFINFLRRHKLYVFLIGLYLTYLLKWRYDYFIDQANHTLHTYSILQRVDRKLRRLAVDNLRDQVYKDPAMVDSLAKLLYNLVTTDQEVKDLFTRQFIDILRLENIDKDTKWLVERSLHQYLSSDTAVKHLSMILTKNVMQD